LISVCHNLSPYKTATLSGNSQKPEASGSGQKGVAATCPNVYYHDSLLGIVRAVRICAQPLKKAGKVTGEVAVKEEPVV
jgi:hypothetical protein